MNPSLRDRAIDGAFLVAMAGVAWLAVFGHRGVAPCVGVMALAAALRARVWRDGFSLLAPSRLIRDPLSIAAVAGLAFTIWIAITRFWSPTPDAEWLALTVLVAILSPGAIAHEAAHAAPRRAGRLAAIFAIAVTTAAALLLFEGLSGGYWRSVTPPVDATPLRGKDMIALGRGVTAIGPLVFAAAVILKRVTGSWAVALAPAAALFVAAAQFSIFSNTLALCAGIAAFALALGRPRAAILVLAALFLLALAATPFIAAALPVETVFDNGSVAPASWEQRLVVWREAGARALGECWPVGCGADYARAWSSEGAMINVPGSAVPLPAMPTHPHNLFLQIWLELGVPGAVFFAIAIAAGAIALRRARLDALTMAAITGAAGFSFISVMIEFSLWQVWRLAVFALAAFGAAVSYSFNKLKQ